MGRPYLQLHNDDSVRVFEGLRKAISDKRLAKTVNYFIPQESYALQSDDSEWHYIGFSVNIKDKVGIFYLDDKVEKFDTEGRHLLNGLTKFKPVIGGNRFDASRSFYGAISCVQIFNDDFNEAGMHFKKNCSASAAKYQTSQCPENFNFYDGVCYQVRFFQLTVVDHVNFSSFVSDIYHKGQLCRC